MSVRIVMLGALSGSRLIGVCGLNIDPYADAPDVGRVRHLYVLASHRGQGVARLLVGAVIAAARDPFVTLRLRTNSEAAARLYESLGFRRQAGDPHCSNQMKVPGSR